MNFFDTTSILDRDNRNTLFPKLKKNTIKENYSKSKDITNFSINEKSYRLTSNQIIKGFQKQQISPNKTLRRTLMRSFKDEQKKCILGYTIIKQIGKGGFAIVYQVRDNEGNKFAMKQYALQTSLQCYQNEVIVGQAFFQKGKIKSKHKIQGGCDNIIVMIDKFKIGKKGYIVQQLCGQSLGKLISQIQGVFHNNQRIYEIRFKDFYTYLIQNDNLARIFIQICNAVDTLNSEGFTHCDLKLENILVIEEKSEKPIIKIIDFGSTFELSKGLPKITITPQYMPPELLLILQNGSTQYQCLKKIDNWSIGCILLQILTGLPLWFKYKCKIEMKGRSIIQLGYFALTNRQYQKIIKKQKQLCDNLCKINFTNKQFQKYRNILKKLLCIDVNKRITLKECIKQLNKFI